MASTPRAPYEEHPDQLELPFSDPEIGIFCNPKLYATVFAKPMDLETYLDLRGWKKDYPDLELQREGYLVERPDMGPPNHESFPFFIAWLSKSEFDRHYRKAKPNEFIGLGVS